MALKLFPEQTPTMDEPVFTIIIPTFNSGKTIRRALNSIVDQTFTSFQIQIIDGASKDDTLKIIREYAETDQRIQFISEKDAGIYDAMNKGIGRAVGDWLYFLGSDDRLHDRTVLEKIYAESQKGDYLLLYGNIISEKNGKYGGPVTVNGLIKKNISHQAMFFQKKIFTQFGNYNTGYKTHADWDFNLRLFERVNGGLKYINVTIADYASGGLSSAHETEFLRNILFPLRLKQLTDEKQRRMESVAWFDEWWRFIRNARIRTMEDLKKISGNHAAPFPVPLIVKAQQGIPSSALTNGFLSKFFMSVTYSRYLFYKILNKI
jgi:glycosyltransferase involved in cell wall biosynthesis